MRKGFVGRLALALIAFIVLFFLLIPIIAVVGGSFGAGGTFSFPPEELSLEQYVNAFKNKEHLRSLTTSLTTALLAAIGAIVFCVPASVGISKSNSRFAQLMKSIFMLPIYLPGIVWGVGMLLLMGKVNIHGSQGILVVAHMVLVTPHMMRCVGTSLNEFNYTLEDAAASLGASPAKAFLRVTLPQIVPGVIVGVIYSFMVSFSELVITLFIAGSRVTTFPVRVYSEMRTEGLNPMVLAYSTIIIVVVLIISVIGEKTTKWSRFFG